uniref:Carnosine N-methyltransferase n=1 Tax=Panagrolaimus sp. JU765 TaxID=591449 RepID=A0AC34R3X9_9BILA
DRMREILIPDVDMSSGTFHDRKNSFGFAMGDFTTSFEEGNVYDAIVTVFFLDTAKNPIQYMRIIHRLLKPGGVWINFGPLLYHFADMSENSMECIELPFDEIVSMVEKIGFKIEKQEGREQNPPSFYCKNNKSMLNYYYDCGYFEAVKNE